MTSAQMAGLPEDVPLKVEGVALAIQVNRRHLNLAIFLSRPLHTFKMDDHYGDLNLQMLHLPWAQLRCLELNSGQLHSMSRVIGLLRQCTSLEVCLLSLYLIPNAESDGVIGEVMPTVTLPILRKLTIHMGSNAKNLCALSHFLLPSLRILEIDGGEWTYNIREVFRRHLNLHQLHELDIARVNNSPTIVSILKDAPLLRRLSLPPHAMFDEECLRGLGNGHLGRNLELLKLHARSCNADDISKMVEARLKTRKLIPGIAPLFQVHQIPGG
ncbi:hypothetical protein APHAL10511_006854 [Amanita phalloides]|nr:hypothetical protein APHAL10511_006854 [Amanita phalloides]